MKKDNLKQREEQILLLLKKFDFMTRDQLNKYFRLGTIQNTNRVLRNLSPYLNYVREGYQTIYYLNKEGRAYVDCLKIRKKGGHINHTLMRNDFWLFLNSPPDWRSEIKVSDGSTTVIVDALYSQSLQKHFLEVDHTQTMKENRVKIERYKKLHQNGLLSSSLGHFPVVVWLTSSELRKKLLIEACKELPRYKVYTHAEIK